MSNHLASSTKCSPPSSSSTGSLIIASPGQMRRCMVLCQPRLQGSVCRPQISSYVADPGNYGVCLLLLYSFVEHAIKRFITISEGNLQEIFDQAPVICAYWEKYFPISQENHSDSLKYTRILIAGYLYRRDSSDSNTRLSGFTCSRSVPLFNE